MNLKEKYDLLMERMADKSLTPWLCYEWGEILLLHEYEEAIEYDLWDTESNSIFHTTWVPWVIIWHKITIGRVLQRWFNKKITMETAPYVDDEQWFVENVYRKRPKDKLDKPIEPTEEFEPLIDYLLTISK